MYIDKAHDIVHLTVADFNKITSLFVDTYHWIDDIEIQLNGRDISNIVIHYDPEESFNNA